MKLKYLSINVKQSKHRYIQQWFFPLLEKERFEPVIGIEREQKWLGFEMFQVNQVHK
jgi:hypothetical protein